MKMELEMKLFNNYDYMNINPNRTINNKREGYEKINDNIPNNPVKKLHPMHKS